jgi:hypothetical protein
MTNREAPTPAGATLPAHAPADTSVTIGDFEIAVLWEERAGRPEPVSVTVTTAGRRPLSAGAIRRLPLGEAFTTGRRQLDSLARHVIAEGEPDDLTERAGKFVARGAQRGQALTNDDLEAVAAAYRAAWLWGRPVTEAVQQACHLSRSGAAKRIMKARAAGLLDGVGVRP